MINSTSTVIIHLIQSSGYVGIFILMTLESALIPIPSEVTMPFAGFLAGQGHLVFLAVVLTGAIGNLTGSWISYGIGYYLEENVILNWVKKYGKFLLITENEYENSTRWLKKYGAGISFFSRILPGVRTFISLPAGLAEIRFWKFSTYTFLGSLIWCTILTYVGLYFGNNWHFIEPIYRKFELLIIVALIILVLLYINHKLKVIKFNRR